MNTGLVDSWSNVDQLGAIYPFVGTEGLLAFAGIAFWLIWHFMQIRKESAEFAEDINNINAKGGASKLLEKEASGEIRG